MILFKDYKDIVRSENNAGRELDTHKVGRDPPAVTPSTIRTLICMVLPSLSKFINTTHSLDNVLKDENIPHSVCLNPARV